MKALCVRIIVILLAACMILGVAGCSPSRPYELEKDDLDAKKSALENLAYGYHDRHRLDVLLPAPLGELQEDVPAFVLIHGGGWTGGDKSDFHYLRQLLNDNGYAAICINYKLIGDGAIYTDMLEDITSALNFLILNGKSLKIKTDKIALWGNSAGGHLALLYSYRNKLKSPIRLAMVVAQAAPTDFSDPAFYETDQTTLNSRLSLVSSLIGEQVITYDNLPLEISEASPITHALAGYIPTLLAHGEKDTIVPYTNATRLYDQLVGYGQPIKAELIGYPNSGHDLSNDPDKTDEAMQAMSQITAKYFPSAVLHE